MATVDILLPTPLKGSGGHRTIVANAEALAAAGHRVRLHVQQQHRQPDPVAKTRAWFPVRHCEVSAGWPDRLPDSDALMATAWFTAPHVAQVATDAAKVYFVQDYEPLFHPAGDLAVAAGATYSAGFAPVVIGRWLQHKLLADHDQQAWSVPFTADLDVYRPGRGAQVRRVVAVYQPDKPRRCPALLVATLRELLDRGIEVVTIGGTKDPKLGTGHRHRGVLSVTELGQLYAGSAAGLCLSASNPSRVPFEMMAAGMPFVDLHLPNTVFDFPDQACRLADPQPRALADAVEQVLENPDLGRAGVAFMHERPATAEGQAFVGFVEDVLAGHAPQMADPKPIYRHATISTSMAAPFTPQSNPSRWRTLLKGSRG